MEIAIPRAHTPDEHRVAITPAGARTLTHAGHVVFVEEGAGAAAGFSDDAYSEAGARLVFGPLEIYARGQILATIDGLPDTAPPTMRPGQIVCGFLHLGIRTRRAVQSIAAARLSTVSYELIQTNDGALPVLMPMSEICGRLLPQIAGHLLETPSGGRGTLLAPVPGVPSAEVVILGAGVVGSSAAAALSAWGVQTTVLDRDIERLRHLAHHGAGAITTRLATEGAIEQSVPFADVLIGAVHTAGNRAPQLVSAELVAQMKPRSVVIDVAIDQGGCIATSRPTTHRDPTFLASGVVHYAVPNIPSAAARTASHALNNAVLPYLLQIAARGLEGAAARDMALARAVGLRYGEPQQRGIAGMIGGETPMESL
jgi:alanine dehydrogenase